MKGLCDQSSPQMGVPFLQMRSVGSYSTSGREKEGITCCPWSHGLRPKNDKGDNEMILVAVHRSPYSRGKPQKTSARRPSDEGAVLPVIA